MYNASPNKTPLAVSVRPMLQTDLPEAARIFRVAFGTFLGAADPETFWADQDYISTRWRADPAAALVAEASGALVGSNIVTHWGSFGFFGPLTVRPDLWGQRVAQALLGPTMELFEEWRIRDAGLLTFARSAKHVGLYQKFGFWPRFLTALMYMGVTPREAPSTKYSALSLHDQDQALAACRELTGAIYDGLDVGVEIRSVKSQKLGETILLWSGDVLDAFAVCHCGEGTEAGKGNCYVKFAAARPGPGVEIRFGHLLDACEALAAEKALEQLHADVNVSRSQAYRRMLQRGFRASGFGVAMHRPDAPAFNRPDVFVMDDWR